MYVCGIYVNLYTWICTEGEGRGVKVNFTESEMVSSQPFEEFDKCICVMTSLVCLLINGLSWEGDKGPITQAWKSLFWPPAHISKLGMATNIGWTETGRSPELTGYLTQLSQWAPSPLRSPATKAKKASGWRHLTLTSSLCMQVHTRTMWI